MSSPGMVTDELVSQVSLTLHYTQVTISTPVMPHTTISQSKFFACKIVLGGTCLDKVLLQLTFIRLQCKAKQHHKLQISWKVYYIG